MPASDLFTSRESAVSQATPRSLQCRISNTAYRSFNNNQPTANPTAAAMPSARRGFARAASSNQIRPASICSPAIAWPSLIARRAIFAPSEALSEAARALASKSPLAPALTASAAARTSDLTASSIRFSLLVISYANAVATFNLVGEALSHRSQSLASRDTRERPSLAAQIAMYSYLVSVARCRSLPAPSSSSSSTSSSSSRPSSSNNSCLRSIIFSPSAFISTLAFFA